MERQQLNVFRMRLLGAEVREVAAGTATLKVGIRQLTVSGPAISFSMRSELFRLLGADVRELAASTATLKLNMVS